MGPDGADGVLGNDTATAIVKFRTAHGLTPYKPVFDTDLERELGLLAIQDPVVQAVGNTLINLIVGQYLKGLGINMDFAKISKAIAGGISGLLATTGTMAIVYFNLPPADVAHFPSFIYSVVPYINEALGFAVGFCTVYFAPPNKG